LLNHLFITNELYLASHQIAMRDCVNKAVLCFKLFRVCVGSLRKHTWKYLLFY